MKFLFKQKGQASINSRPCVPSQKRKQAVTTLLVLTFLHTSIVFSQEAPIQDTIKNKQVDLEEVLVSAVRVTAQTPVTFSNLSKKELSKRNLGQDIPVLMNYLPSVVTTTDAGNGVGYSGIRVRGSDATRVNITINGIPYNDSESQGTFWVNMPDFASSVQSLQLQRGVGTSTNGSGAFGASLNMSTDATSEKASGEISNSFGSFNTHKHTVKFSTGKLNEHFELAGRLSVIKSDGYIDRASSDLKSYFLQGTYIGETSFIKALVFGGKQSTYQAWNGIDAATLKNNRRYNSAGAYTDENGNARFYDNETDNYNQDHYQLHWNERLGNYWSTTLAVHLTRGKGYYENYKEDAKFSAYGLSNVVIGGETITKTDLVRRKWLDNYFYGTTFSANYKKDKLDLILGGGWNKYEGNHYGNVIWAKYASNGEIGIRYYDDDATKTDFNFFAKANYQLTEQWSLFADMQYRTIRYKADGAETGLVNDRFNFFNPKAGLTFTVNEFNSIYFSYARANREPRRNDYESGSVKPEKLNDFELGWRYATAKTKLNVNAYYMRYKDQLVLTGELNDVGAPVTTNSGDSYRLGLEVDAVFALSNQWSVRPNIALSDNKNIDFYNAEGETLVNLGKTNIAFSPNIVAANAFSYMPNQNLQFSFLSKFVGKQYMGNIDVSDSKLDSYFVNDLNVVYEIQTKTIFKSIVFTGLLNNIFDVKYESNGFYDPEYGPGYYPQAGINFLVGMQLKF
ncbi:TonB-dependent receptor [Flavobacterium sp. '19STA2R22 D10 B1']|uniref:TonB-dependent receptor n=1 Tax=Flavobacterium aerium TaxID=3037261 RepID=UPI00278C65A4|nr:TonB-dependent receptor [Flavobacterium sp. '19STA2R22 D10 B1']